MIKHDLNKLRDFAVGRGISIRMGIWEGDESVEVETVSESRAECFYMENAETVDHFINEWNINFQKKSGLTV